MIHNDYPIERKLCEVEERYELLTPWTGGHDLQLDTWQTMRALVAQVRASEAAITAARRGYLAAGRLDARASERDAAIARAFWNLQVRRPVDGWPEEV